MNKNTEPIPVKHALRLCEMALLDSPRAHNAIPGEDSFIVLSRAVMRPMLVMLRLTSSGCYGSAESITVQDEAFYPPIAALRDHYDATRPGWRDFS